MAGSKKKAVKSSSNVFSMFSQNQMAEFKEAFGFIDQDKDGIVSKNDIRATFDQMGRLTSDKELDEMMSEASGPINFTQFVTIFANKAGGMDEEETIINAFTIFDDGDGTCTEEKLRKMLCTFGEKLTEQEANDVFAEAPMDGSKINLKRWANVLTKGTENPEEPAAS